MLHISMHHKSGVCLKNDYGLLKFFQMLVHRMQRKTHHIVETTADTAYSDTAYPLLYAIRA